MKYGKTSALVAVAALVLVPGTARAGAQGQAEQFTPEYREIRRSYDEKHTPKIEAPDSVKRGQWFEVTVTVGAGSTHPSLGEHFVRYIALYKDSAEIARVYLHPVFSYPKAVFTIALDEGGTLRASADEYLTKPVDHAALSARVRSMLRIKALHDTVTAQAEEIARWNATLERRVTEQVTELEQMSRLKRFFSPQLADAIVTGGDADPLRPHRREISVVFLDLRGFTAFAEMSEPEEVSDVLGAYHAEMGHLILEHEGTLEGFTGDGMMIFFHGPVQVANPEERAVRMAEAMRARIRVLGAEWRRRGYDLDISMGIAKGYATIGAIGFKGRQDYAAIGSVTNLAHRLCAEASPDQILISQRIHAVVTDLVKVKEVGPLQLKGFHRPIVAYEVVDLKERSS